MTRGRRAGMWMLAAAVGGMVVMQMVARRAEPATSATMAATMPGRTPEAIEADLMSTSAQLHLVLPSLGVIADEGSRKTTAAQAIPLLRKMSALLAEFATAKTDPAEKSDLWMQHYEFQAFRAAFGDKDAETSLEADANDSVATKALMAKTSLALAQWWLNSKDAAAQGKVLDAYAVIAKANPTDDGVASIVEVMLQFGAANDAVKKQALELVRSHLSGPTAAHVLEEGDAWLAEKALEGKPLVIAGRTTTGGKWSSADWKGKVILVDFWATWCIPCREDIPHTKKLYEDYHAKGLEVVGVDCDGSDEQVNGFIKENGMAWPQLREESQKAEDEWNPLTKQLHVGIIPQIFLIDKKGVLRSVDGREDTEAKVKALLAEDGG